MANYQDQNTVAQDTVFQGRCRIALQNAAVNIIAEDPQTQNHAQRAAFAIQVLTQPQQISSYNIALSVLTNSTIAGEVTVASLPGATSTVADNDLQFAINSLFNALAGIST